MRGLWNGSQWVGSYIRHRSGTSKSFPFAAVPETSTDRNTGVASNPLTVPQGNYQVHFQGDDSTDNSTTAKFWNNSGSLYGTLIAPDGDYGLLLGEPASNGIQFSRFTGWQATVISLEPKDDGWSGTFFAASSDKPRLFTLQPRSDLQLETFPKLRTAMKNTQSSLSFSCMSPSGETVRNTDDRFRGKALVVDIMGTWCHNCLDEAPILQQLQERFGKDGLEIVGLSFEITNDPELAKKNLTLYKDRFGLFYTLLFCGDVDEANVNMRLHSQLDNFFAFPTTLFIDRSNKVRTIHSGFRGPGTGEEFQSQVREFFELAEQLVR